MPAVRQVSGAQQQTLSTSPQTPPQPPPETDAKPATDVFAGAMARAASQSTIHPLDTVKVRMQNRQARSALKNSGQQASIGSSAGKLRGTSTADKFFSLYKGVGGAATAAGLIIGTYFAFYSTSKRFLRRQTNMNESSVAAVAGATAAIGSGAVKVPLAVCIRSVQAGIYPDAVKAATSITQAAGIRGLFTGFLPTLLEDVPDSAVKFAVYESLRSFHSQVSGGRSSTNVEDLLMGSCAGAVAAAATTPLDVIKTVMMCSASKRPTVVSAARAIMSDGGGIKPFFRGVGPRALSNGLNSGIFFCFFEAIRAVLVKQQAQRQLEQQQAAAAFDAKVPRSRHQRAKLPGRSTATAQTHAGRTGNRSSERVSNAAACLTLALPCGLHPPHF